VIDVVGENPRDYRPVPRLIEFDVIDLGRHHVGDGLEEQEILVTFAAAVGEIDGVAEHVATLRIGEAAHILAVEIGPHAMHQDFGMRVNDDKIAARSVIVHHAQIVQGITLSLVQRHFAGARQRLIVFYDAIGHADDIFQFSPATVEHALPGLIRAPAGDCENPDAHHGKRQPQPGAQASLIHIPTPNLKVTSRTP